MGYAEQRAMVEAALARDSDDDGSYPPAAGYLTAARERLGLSEQQLRRRLGSVGHVCMDLEWYDSELFQCASVAVLVGLAAVLRTSVASLLFGDSPASALPVATCADVSRRVGEVIAAERISSDEFGNRVGWDVEPLLHDPAVLATYNVQGLRDICQAVGVDWMSVVESLERQAAQENGAGEAG